MKDWEADGDNKLVAGQDVLAARPTLLLALALEGLEADERSELLALLERAYQTDGLQFQAQGLPPLGLKIVDKVRALFQRAGVFEKAEKLIEKFRARAEAVADDVEPSELRELLYFLVDTVLDRSVAPVPEPESLPLVQLSK